MEDKKRRDELKRRLEKFKDSIGDVRSSFGKADKSIQEVLKEIDLEKNMKEYSILPQISTLSPEKQLTGHLQKAKNDHLKSFDCEKSPEKIVKVSLIVEKNSPISTEKLEKLIKNPRKKSPKEIYKRNSLVNSARNLMRSNLKRKKEFKKNPFKT